MAEPAHNAEQEDLSPAETALERIAAMAWLIARDREAKEQVHEDREVIRAALTEPRRVGVWPAQYGCICSTSWINLGCHIHGGDVP